jgi:hypothetical protein
VNQRAAKHGSQNRDNNLTIIKYLNCLKFKEIKEFDRDFEENITFWEDFGLESVSESHSFKVTNCLL